MTSSPEQLQRLVPNLWPKKGVAIPVSTEVGLKDIQARIGIYSVPKQVDSARLSQALERERLQGGRGWGRGL